jgi:Calx-beta domain
MRPVRTILLIVAALYAIVLASGLGVFDHPQGPSNAFAYEYSTTITTSSSTETSTSTSTTSTTTPTSTKPGKGCGDKNHLHERRFECKVVIHSVSQNEGNADTTSFTFAVTLSATAEAPVTVDFATANGSAIAPGDFTPTSGTLTIPAGAMGSTITISVVGDTALEKNEAFYVKLSHPSPNAYLGNTQGVGTILNDD